MNRNQNESVELFRAFTVEEIREQEQQAVVLGGKWSTPWRGDNSSGYSTVD